MAALERSLCEQILQELSFVFRDILFFRLEVYTAELMGCLPDTFIGELTERFSITSLEFLIDVVLQTKNNIKGNANIKLSIDLLIKKIGENIQ